MNTLMKTTVAALALGVAVQANAAVQWTTGPGANNHWYDISPGPATFTQALTNAATATPIAGFTSHLVTVTSTDEANFLFANFGHFGQAWAAGSDGGVEGTWKWLAGPESGQTFWQDGTTLTYAAWHGGEPNNVGDEDGLLLHQFGGITWNDAPAGNAYRYIIEYGPSMGGGGAVPEPTTWALMIAGFGLVGGAMRRRAKVAITYA